MKVVKFKVKNLFGIKEFEASGKSLELTGDNGTGKTSVLDAFKLALTNRSNRDFIIRDGEQEGEVLIETDVGVRVHRKIRENRADYKSIKDPTLRGENTESFLRKIFTNLQLNPIEFMSMTKEEQNRIVLDLIDFEWNLDWIKEQFGEIVPDVNYEQNILCVLHDIQDEKGFYFVKRQNINREAREKTAIINDIGSALPANYNAKHWEDINVGDLYKKISAIQKDNAEVEKAKQIVGGKENKVRGIRADYESSIFGLEKEIESQRDSLEQTIRNLEAELKDRRQELSDLQVKKHDRMKMLKLEYEKNVAGFEGEVKQFEELAKREVQPIDELQAEADEIQRMKSFVNEYKRMKSYEVEVDSLKKESEDITGKIEHARTLPGKILETCKIPVQGLTVVDGLPLINGLPISNLSEGEKLNLCIDVAMQSEGSLDILLIDGVEKFSAANRTKLYARLKDKGCQFLATRTTDDENLTVIEI